jgi:hypothetical protein
MNSNLMDLLLVERLDNLPTLPGVALRIIEAVKNENASMDELGKILSLDHWVKQAGQASYEAKRRGRDRFFVYADAGEPMRRTFAAGMV